MNALALADLEYLTAVLKEAGRMYPALPSGKYRRQCSSCKTCCLFTLLGQPRQVPPDGAFIVDQVIPGGTVVFVHPRATSMAPFNFVDPELFVPERWLAEPPARYADDKLDASMPFSLGPRSCVGQRYFRCDLVFFGSIITTMSSHINVRIAD
jgi:cytochrome P450